MVKPEARVFVMIEDLSRRSLIGLLGGIGITMQDATGSPALRQYVAAYYEAGRIEGESIEIAWEDDNR